MSALCETCEAAPICGAILPPHLQPPDDREWTVDGVFVKQMYLAQPGMLVPQHAHTYAHLTMLAAGSVRVWRDGDLLGDFVAPAAIEIPAEAKHSFLSLQEETILYCLHNIARAGAVEITSGHQLVGGV